MRRIRTADVPVGSVLASPVVNEQGTVIIQAGTRLNAQLLERLLQRGVPYVLVEWPGFEGLVDFEPLSPFTLAGVRNYMRKLIEAARKEPANRRVLLPLRELDDWVNRIVEELEERPDADLLYPRWGDEEESWIAFSLNRAILAGRTFLGIGGREQAKHSVAAGLLQDVGVWRLAPEVRAAFLAGEGDRVPEARAHVAHTQAMLAGDPRLNAFVKAIAAQHHERADGSGYPQGRSGDEIYPLARVMAVVDAYLSAVDRDRDAMLPADALEWLMASAGFEFDLAAIKAFRTAIAPYPIGLEVELNTGEAGVVSALPSAVRIRPQVRILRNAAGERVAPREVNLAEQKTYVIHRIRPLPLK